MRNNSIKLFLAYLITTFIGAQSFAQEWKQDLFFRNISVDEGLSNPTVSSICQDARGYMWIGTVDGLNRYDGNEFKVYLKDTEDTNSIASNRIHEMFEDSDYNLWIGTSEGLCQFNYKTEQFNNYKSDDEFNRTHDISYDKKNNRIWIAASFGGLKYLDLNSGLVKSYGNEKLNESIVVKLLNLDDEYLYIGTTNNGAYKLDLDTFNIEEFCNTKSGLFQISSNWIKILERYDDRLFIGTEGDGLIVFHLKDGTVLNYNPQNSPIPSADISAIVRDQNGIIYIGTKDGIVIYNDGKGIVSSHQNEEGNLSSLSSNIIRSLVVDKNNNLWVGTQQSGIDLMSSESKNMTLVKKKQTDQNSLSGNNITSFAQDGKGGIWIGTQSNGLNYYKDGKYTVFKADGSRSSLQDNEVTDICIDRHDAVWVSTLNGGLSKLNNGKFIHFDKYSRDSWIGSVRKLHLDTNGILWIATSEGLDSYDIERKEFKNHFLAKENEILTKRKNIRTLLVDREGDVLAGTSTGLFVYDPKMGKVDHHRKKSNDSTSIGHEIIVEIFEDSKGRIWLGSSIGGLMLFDKKNSTFKNYGSHNGFPTGLVASIKEDVESNLWIGSNKEIIKFSPSTEKSVIFGKSYGLQNIQFNRRSSIKCDDGRLIFGGINGFNVFRPEELVMDKSPLNVVITNLKIFDQSVQVFDETEILNQHISLTNDLDISYKQSKNFSISFSAMHYANPSQVKYAYTLEGFDEKWNFIQNETKVSFTNLEPREYVFKVMGSANGQWDNSVRELSIHIRAPWYMTLWFKVGAVLLFALLSINFYYSKVRLHKERQEILERLVNEKNYEISLQNEEITNQNEELKSSIEELQAQNEEILNQKEYIHDQNKELTITKEELQKLNSTLEERVIERTGELKTSNKKLKKTVMELDRFVYSASHDLGAPLKSVMGLVHIAKLESKEQNLQIHLNYIEQSIKKEEMVIKSLIQYSRNSRLALKIKALNLFDLVDQVISELKYMPGSDSVKMINEVPINVSINSDEQRIQTILNNLLSNGVNYRSKDKKDSFVQIQFLEQEHTWQLIVKDNGQGVAEDHHKKIFEMFHRANEKSDGSGLGLFIVKEAVDRLDGKISLKSTLGIGSEFMLEFPNR